MTDYKLLIDGKLIEGDAVMDVINPATEEVLARCPRASEAQLNLAVAAAKKAFPGWAATPIEDRRAAIIAIADAIEASSEDLARLLTQEQGKPLAEAIGEIGATVTFFREFAKYDIPHKVIEDSNKRYVEMCRRPLGVIGAITAWNYPLLIVAFKLPFALLAGNTVVLKPAPTTPLTTLKLGELASQILPPGVLNIITDQNDLGAKLTAHHDIAKITFTGSTATGRKVMSSAAATIKRLTLELGGNDAAIVLPDADPVRAASGVFNSAFANAGQVCLAIKRTYVHSDIYEPFCEAIRQLAENAVVDDGLKQGATIGPLQNRQQYDIVKSHIAAAREQGKIIAGGTIEDRAGYFIRPTIVRDISNGTRLVDEEQFGPILPIIEYREIDDAIELANATPWGLGGSVWSSDSVKAREIAKRMNTGTVWINTHLDIDPGIPFGGAKQSGLGVEYAEEGLSEYTQLHVINEAR